MSASLIRGRQGHVANVGRWSVAQRILSSQWRIDDHKDWLGECQRRGRSSTFVRNGSTSGTSSQQGSTTPDDVSSPPSFASSSVSANEVRHFSALAASWWDPHGPSRLLHLMNPLRHEFLRSCLQTSPPSPYQSPSPSRPSSHSHGAVSARKLDYLDIGCGGGIFASSAARLPTTRSVTAVDPTPEVIKVAKLHQRADPQLEEPKLKYLNCRIEDLKPAEGGSPQYDVISVFEVLEHISSPSSFLSIALPHLRPGGWLVGSTIARHPLSYITTKLIAEAPVIGVVPRGTHDWNQYINPAELSSWFEGGKASTQTGGARYGSMKIQGVIYLPLLGWRFVDRSERFGNYFFGVQRLK